MLRHGGNGVEFGLGGNEEPFLDVERHGQVVSQLGCDVVPLRGVDVQSEAVEEGERHILDLHGRCEGLGEKGEVVHEWEQSDSCQSSPSADLPLLGLACFSDLGRSLGVP